MAKSEIPSLLAFERKLDCSDAVFGQTDGNNPEARELPVTVSEKSIRGTISNRLKNPIANDPAKLDTKIENANLQTVDVAALGSGCDTLIARFTLKVLPFDGSPCICNGMEYRGRLLETVTQYLQKEKMQALAERYAANIANGRWLWRNRMGAENIRITVSNKNDSITVDNAKALPLDRFDRPSENVAKIAEWISQGLSGEAFILLNIEARVRAGYGQEVYPSQEFISDTDSNNKNNPNNKRKVLYQTDGKAGMHSQKIGNAIRTIDTWYAPDAAFPIAAEPYGTVTTLGTAFRQPKQKNDFYTLFDNWVLKGEQPSIEQQHYVISVLIRGGVFGSSEG